MAKAKGLTQTSACKRRIRLDRQSSNFGSKAVHAKRGKRHHGGRGERGYKRLCQGARSFLPPQCTYHESERSQTSSKHLRFSKQTSILRLWLVPRSVGALVQDWCIGWPPARGHAVCRLLLIANVIRPLLGCIYVTHHILNMHVRELRAVRDACFPNVTHNRSLQH